MLMQQQDNQQNREERIMRELYTSPVAEVIEFDIRDVITTSGNPLDGVTGEAANGGSEGTGSDWIDIFDQ